MNRSAWSLLSRLTALSMATLLLSGVAGAPRQAIAQSDTPATPAAEPIWFVLAPEGKANGDYFDVQIAPGESATLTAQIGNGSSNPVSAVVYAADVYSDVNGGFAMLNAGDQKTGATTWLDLETETLDFAAREGITKNITVTVPEGTAPGEYVTGLAIETADSSAISGSPLRQTIRLATGVLITVPGPLEPKFEIGTLAIEIAPEVTIISGVVANAGNVRVRPTGSITLLDATGATIVDAPIAMNSVYPGTQTAFVITVTGVLPEGLYAASVELTDPATDATAAARDIQVTAAPPAAPPPLTISSVAITPMPSPEEIVFVGVQVNFTNTGPLVTNAELMLRVLQDGELIAEHMLASSLTIQVGDTVIDQPYIPATGSWEPGDYQFQVVLATIDPQSGSRTVIGSFTVDQIVTVS